MRSHAKQAARCNGTAHAPDNVERFDGHHFCGYCRVFVHLVKGIWRTV